MQYELSAVLAKCAMYTYQRVAIGYYLSHGPYRTTRISTSGAYIGSRECSRLASAYR